MILIGDSGNDAVARVWHETGTSDTAIWLALTLQFAELGEKRARLEGLEPPAGCLEAIQTRTL
jgi:hypothetical protein